MGPLSTYFDNFIPMEERERLLNEYARGAEMIEEALAQYPPGMWKHKPDADSWSIHEIIIHLADSEVNGYVRCRKLIAENGSEIAPYDQDKWANELNYHDLNAGDYLALMKWLRSNTYKLLKNTPEITWGTHAVNHPEEGNITLDDWLKSYVKHVDRHLYQMQRVYDHWKNNQS